MIYKGYTYPALFDNRICRWLWKKLFCRKGWHLWDEVSLLEDHYLWCDACAEYLWIANEPNETTKEAMEEIDLHSCNTIDELFKELNK